MFPQLSSICKLGATDAAQKLIDMTLRRLAMLLQRLLGHKPAAAAKMVRCLAMQLRFRRVVWKFRRTRADATPLDVRGMAFAVRLQRRRRYESPVTHPAAIVMFLSLMPRHPLLPLRKLHLTPAYATPLHMPL
jgi:hypothetical protein